MSDTKKARALLATDKMENIILERNLINAIPKSKRFSLRQVCKYTGYKYYSLRNYIHNDLYTISKNTIKITNDTQLLSDKSKEYVARLIKKIIYPTKYVNNMYVYLIAKLLDNSYFTPEEQKFIELMTNELFLIINHNEFSHKISIKDLVGFNQLNQCPFLYTTRQIYNDILHRKICAGDNISKYIKEHLTDIQYTEKLENSCTYDYIFDNNGTLKCDLETNIDILIKNFLSTVICSLTDDKIKTILLLKLNSKYPFLLSEKSFIGCD